MNRPTRLIELVQLLGGKRFWSPREIAERFGISERTAYRDVADLSASWNIPLTRNEHGYKLVEGSLMRPLALSAVQHAALKLALDNPAFLAQEGVARELELINAKLDTVTAPAQDTPDARVLAGPERSGAIGPAVNATLEQAIQRHTPVSLLYRSLASNQTTRRGVDPYVVFHRRHAWYLVGRCHVRADLRTFRLDRIVEARLLEGAFPPPDFNLDDFLQDTWVVFRGPTVHQVVIHFDAALAPLIEQGVHHPSERITPLDNGALEYRCELSHLDEIARWIVGFAGRARAVEPPELVGIVADIAGGALEVHRNAAAGKPPAPARQRPRP